MSGAQGRELGSPEFEGALSLARRGDPQVRHHLTRFIKHNPNPGLAKAAAATLREDADR